jgi:hypothetical protein
LPFHQYPKPHPLHGYLELFRNLSFEFEVGLILESSKAGDVTRRMSGVNEICQIEAIIILEGLVSDNMDIEIHELFLVFASTVLYGQAFFLKATF